MADVIKLGFEYKLSKDYVKVIEKEFLINLKLKGDVSGDMFFNSFYDKMNVKLKNNVVYNKLKIENTDFIFESFSKKVWKYNFYLFLKNNKPALDKFNECLKLYSNKNSVNSKNSKNNKTPDIKHKILEIFGEEFKHDINKIIMILTE
jgi:hypothetical protein